VIWFLAGILIEATDNIAKRFNRTGFAIAFLLLGILTSISELSVAINAIMEKVPQISAGNLMGASIVIFLFIIPILAIFGNGIQLKHLFSRRDFALSLFVVTVPALLALDGELNRYEGILMIALYVILLYFIQRKKDVKDNIEELKEKIFPVKKHYLDLGKIVGGAVIIFFMSRLLIDEAIYFADLLKIPLSLIGLLILSIGTNVPELVIAVRAIVKKHKEIAFGDYLGSATFNTLIFGLLIIINGPFKIEKIEIVLTFIFLYLGLTIFYIFSRSKNDISKYEGMVLALIYFLFIITQIFNV